MLDSGLEGASFAVLTAVMGLAQAFLSQNYGRTQARIFNALTVYFVLQFFTILTLFCVWKIPSPLPHRHLALQLLLECAWLEGLSIPLCAFFGAIKASCSVRAVLRYIAGVTVSLHTLGFLLLVLHQDNGKALLFGSSLLVPFSLSAALLCFLHNGLSKHIRPIAIGTGSLLTICGLVSLTAVQNVDKFLQGNVILISLTSMAFICLRLVQPLRKSEVNKLRLSTRLPTYTWSCKEVSAKTGRIYARSPGSGSIKSPHILSASKLQLGKLEACNPGLSHDTYALNGSWQNDRLSSPPSSGPAPSGNTKKAEEERNDPQMLDFPDAFAAPFDIENKIHVVIKEETDYYYSDKKENEKLGIISWVVLSGTEERKKPTLTSAL